MTCDHLGAHVHSARTSVFSVVLMRHSDTAALRVQSNSGGVWHLTTLNKDWSPWLPRSVTLVSSNRTKHFGQLTFQSLSFYWPDCGLRVFHKLRFDVFPYNSGNKGLKKEPKDYSAGIVRFMYKKRTKPLMGKTFTWACDRRDFWILRGLTVLCTSQMYVLCNI